MMRRGLRMAALAVAALMLAGCTGLPMSGPPNAGLPVGEVDDGRTSSIPRADGPRPGANPEQIVAGFLEAGKTPGNSWEIAREFLTEDYAARWKPEAGVSIDSSIVTRDFQSSLEDDDEQETTSDEDATSADVRVQLDQVAALGADGSYSSSIGAAKAEYRLVRDSGGEWRIDDGRDGITLDTVTFENVYEKFSLGYFDRNWSHLVSDLRWFPRRRGMATTISRELISGKPSEWLAPAVKSAFPSDVSLMGDAVTVNDEQVATVPLTRTALEASSVELSRMRTALEWSLAGAGVSEVRLVVDDMPLSARALALDTTIVDPGVLVLTADGFGTASTGGAVAPVSSLSAEIDQITAPIQSIDVSIDARLAALQLRDGKVYSIREGSRNQIDADRQGLLEPTLDPFGFIWSVPEKTPQELLAWSSNVQSFPIAEAWPIAESISQMRVSADGAKVAAVLSSGGQRHLVVAAVIRDGDQVPTGMGAVQSVAMLDGPVEGISWVGADTIAVLAADPDPQLTTFLVGGPASTVPAPADAVAVSGAKTVTGLRVLSSDGVVSAQRGSFWQESISDVLVLGTRAGY